MYIESLEIFNYRNYEYVKVEPSAGLNILIGKNAQGKTNILEAIYLMAIGKSQRTNKDKDLINWNKKDAKIKLRLVKNSGKVTLEMRINELGKKMVLINGVPIKKISELLGELNIVYFFPDDLKLIKEAPQDRRRFMDIDICQASKNYFYLLTKYEKILNQRNKLLKTAKDKSILNDTMPIWDEQFAEIASKIILSRIKFINRLAPLVEKTHSYLTGSKESLIISYQGETGLSSAEIKEKLLIALRQNLDKDYELGYTTIGPHRDDIKVSLNGIDLRAFGSQGQQRTASLALKLAEIDIFEKEKGERPVVLLDDVLSELDDFRQNRLIKLAKTLQTILTCTDSYNAKQNDFTKFVINSGKIIKKEEK